MIAISQFTLELTLAVGIVIPFHEFTHWVFAFLSGWRPKIVWRETKTRVSVEYDDWPSIKYRLLLVYISPIFTALVLSVLLLAIGLPWAGYALTFLNVVNLPAEIHSYRRDSWLLEQQLVVLPTVFFGKHSKG